MKGSVRGSVAAVLASVSIFAALMSGCDAQKTNVFSPGQSEQPVASDSIDMIPSQSIDESVHDGEAEKELNMEIVFGLGDFDSRITSRFCESIERNRERLSKYQKEKAAEAGLRKTEYMTVYGHTVYTGANSDVFIFSGSDLINAKVTVDLDASQCPLYDASKIYDAFGIMKGSLKTEDGVLISEGITDDWLNRNDLAENVSFNSVYIDGWKQENLPQDKAWGDSNGISLSALAGDVGTLREAREKAYEVVGASPVESLGFLPEGSINKYKQMDLEGTVFAINGVFYADISSIQSVASVVGYQDKKDDAVRAEKSFRVLFDGNDTFVILVRKMMIPGADFSGMKTDYDGYLNLLQDEYGKQLSNAGYSGDFVMLQAKVGEEVTVWNPETEKISSEKVFYIGDEGTVGASTGQAGEFDPELDSNVYISLEALERIAGVETMVSPAGDEVNIILDKEYNCYMAEVAKQGGDSETSSSKDKAEDKQDKIYVEVSYTLGSAAGLSSEDLSSRADIKDAKQVIDKVVADEEERLYQEKIQLEVIQKQQEEAKKREEEEQKKIEEQIKKNEEAAEQAKKDAAEIEAGKDPGSVGTKPEIENPPESGTTDKYGNPAGTFNGVKLTPGSLGYSSDPYHSPWAGGTEPDFSCPGKEIVEGNLAEYNPKWNSSYGGWVCTIRGVSSVIFPDGSSAMLG